MAKVSHRPGLCRPKADQGSRPWGPRPAGQGLHGPGSYGGPSALDLWGRGQVLALHWAPVPLPAACSRALCTPRAREDCGRKPLLHCGVPSQPCRARPCRLGQVAHGGGSAGICDAQGGKAAAWALAASPKTLNFPKSHYNQAGTEKQAQWQMRLLPGC